MDLSMDLSIVKICISIIKFFLETDQALDDVGSNRGLVPVFGSGSQVAKNKAASLAQFPSPGIVYACTASFDPAAL